VDFTNADVHPSKGSTEWGGIQKFQNSMSTPTHAPANIQVQRKKQMQNEKASDMREGEK